ncbi:hypothetical protein Sango_2810400 [Sesamum angolense]|uniref:Uncharacterized protein n=1 Tax=Sesamum angolense TaxID=2727404 RepID=A0AAE1VXL8_9LAMI|nr:hypothetical protein Sango_2810400 [Sesamum angolense]
MVLKFPLGGEGSNLLKNLKNLPQTPVRSQRLNKVDGQAVKAGRLNRASRGDESWFVIGDFNTVLDMSKACGQSGDIRVAMEDFNQFLMNTTLINLPMQGGRMRPIRASHHVLPTTPPWCYVVTQNSYVCRDQKVKGFEVGCSGASDAIGIFTFDICVLGFDISLLMRKLLDSWPSPILERLNTPPQNTFIPRKSISDNVLLAQELFFGYNQQRLPPQCALEVDLQKACDMLEWDFLLATLQLFGFLYDGGGVCDNDSILCLFQLCFAYDLLLFYNADEGIEFILPNGITHEIEKRRRTFLWKDNSDTGYAKVVWNQALGVSVNSFGYLQFSSLRLSIVLGMELHSPYGGTFGTHLALSFIIFQMVLS